VSTIFLTWELGGGLGHMMQLAPSARGLVKRGHKVYVALRDVGAAEAAFAGSGVCYLEAPHNQSAAGSPPFPVTRTFAHVLGNTGWNDGQRLFAFGGYGNDSITGGSGRDSLVGEAGDDSFNAQDSEIDTLVGGTGTDSGFWDQGVVTDLVSGVP
jgi:Ca2+-binding RTX toxin-like protein